MHCTSCGFENPDGFRFCGNCGLPLPASGAPSLLADEPGRLPIEIRVLPPATSAADDAERRQLTVMFCDLAGSTSLSARLDPEDLRAVVREYQAVCAEAIEANEGYVAQYLGDGVLAYFGYPRGSEREASRAVRAGLAVVRGVRRLGERLEREQGIGLAVRVGIHTGVVVVGEIGAGQRREQLALGETPNLAARLQGLAEADTVVVSGDTQRLVRREFECEDLGEHEVAGIPAPVRLHRVTRDLAAELARPPAASEPIVGRREELAFLRGCWERVCAGRGEVVLVSGEAGIGKSTLMSAFAASLDDEAVVLSARCLPYFRGTAYQPVVELLQHLLGCPASEAPEHKLHCLGGLLERQGLAVAEMMPVFAAVLSLPYDAGEPEGARMPQQRRERTRAALLELLVGAAAQRPLLLRVEDVHWADPSTLELLELLVRQAPGLRVLALFSHRPEFKPPWGRQPHQTPYPLPRLSEAEVEEIIARLTGGRALPPEVVAQIIGRTDGVPLFVEELTKTVLESGLLREEEGRYTLIGGALPPLAIPATLQDSLEARLDRLATTKELAQLGAVLGREFGYPLLRAVSDVHETVLRRALDRLVDAGLLYQQGALPEAVYSFKHGLIQEAAYQSLLKGVRQGCHHRAALALEERFPEEAAQHPERVAQHYEAAGLAEPAVDAWTRAGRRAVERSDSHEAVEHLRQGLELLASLPPGRARDERELALRLPLGPALTATQGHAAAEVRECYLRALELARALGVEAEHLEIMGGLFASHFVRSEVAEAFELAREMLRSAAAHGDSPWIGAARVAIGVALLKGGSLEHARDHLEEGLRRYDPARHFALAHAMGQDYGVVGWGYSAYAHFALGDAGEALRRAERAAELARALDHPHSLAMALAMLTFVRFFRREPEPALPLLDELEALAGREGFHHWEMDVPPMRAWALAALGRTDEALAVADEVDGAALLGRAGVGPGAARVRVLAEAYLGAGRPADAARLLADVVERLEAEAPEAWWLAEAYRARAVALAQLGNTREAGALLERAAWSARAAGTPLFLLRALLELARLRGGADAALRAALDEARRALPGSDGLAEVREAGSLLDPAAAEPVLVVL